MLPMTSVSPVVLGTGTVKNARYKVPVAQRPERDMRLWR